MHLCVPLTHILDEEVMDQLCDGRRDGALPVDVTAKLLWPARHPYNDKSYNLVTR